MSESRVEIGAAGAWETEIDELGAQGSGWGLLACLSTLLTLRALDLAAAGEGKLLAGVLEDPAADAFAHAGLSEDDRSFLATRVEALPSEVEAWASGSGLFELEGSEDESPEEAARRVQGEALRRLIGFAESAPLGDEGCFDAIARRCLAAAGKTGGSFSTPACVVDLIARLVAPAMRTAPSLYDPCCGAGFLLDACAGAGEAPAVYGQDVDPQALAVLRARAMVAAVLAEGEARELDVMLGDVLAADWHRGIAPFDVIVSHPPTLAEWSGSSSAAIAADERFSGAGALAPKEAADLAFVLHAYHCMAEGAVAALVMFPAPLRRGDAERTIRRYLIEQDAVDAVIQLPPRLFSDSSMAASILVLRKGRQHDDVLFIDAMKEGRKAGEGSVLSPETIERIVCAFERREDEDGFARNVSKGAIVKHAWSLVVADYFEAEKEKLSVDMSYMKRVSESFADPAALRRDKLTGIFPW